MKMLMEGEHGWWKQSALSHVEHLGFLEGNLQRKHPWRILDVERQWRASVGQVLNGIVAIEGRNMEAQFGTSKGSDEGYGNLIQQGFVEAKIRSMQEGHA